MAICFLYKLTCKILFFFSLDCKVEQLLRTANLKTNMKISDKLIKTEVLVVEIALSLCLKKTTQTIGAWLENIVEVFRRSLLKLSHNKFVLVLIKKIWYFTLSLKKGKRRNEEPRTVYWCACKCLNISSHLLFDIFLRMTDTWDI